MKAGTSRKFFSRLMAQDRLHGGGSRARNPAISRRVNASRYDVKYLRRTHGRHGGDALCETIIHHGYPIKRFHALAMQMVHTKCPLTIGASSRECTKPDNYCHNFLSTVNHRSCLRDPPIGYTGITGKIRLVYYHSAHRDKPG